MTDDIFYARRRQLREALKKAAEDLLAHEKQGAAGLDISLDEQTMIAIGPHSFLDDRSRLNAIERLQLNIGPGESFQEDVPWIASFHTDDHVHVFAGDTVREAIDKAIEGAKEIPRK